jgi:hypothetical protein
LALTPKDSALPQCYFLAVCSGSSVDQNTNNATLFNLVEQINVPPGAPPPPQGLIPLEIHAYFQLDPRELNVSFQLRFVMVASSGLETPTDAFTHRCPSPRFRTRTLGLPFPPVVGQYDLRVDWRMEGSPSYVRAAPAWPITILEVDSTPRITH